jgi:iron complex outermembrane recepter protein
MKLTHMRLLLGTAAFTVLGALAPVAVHAQTPASANQSTTQNEDTPTEVGEVVVTGTNISGVKPVGGTSIVVTREEMQQTGLSNAADIIRRLPQVQTAVGDSSAATQGGSSNQGYNGAQVEGINLRGLGPSATLILVDGHRVVAQGSAASIAEGNQVPLAALERIEILPQGASAIYGSDAVAGVVNYVLRKDFDGLEVNARVGNQTGGREYDLGLTAGTHWGSLGGLGNGNIIGSYQHQDRDAFKGGKIDRLRFNLSPLGGPDLRIVGNSAFVGLAPNVVTNPFVAPNVNPIQPTAQGYRYFGVPANNTGVPSAASLLADQPNLVDASDYTDYTGAQKMDQASLYFNQDLTPKLELFGSANYSKRTTRSELLGRSPNITVTPASPYYVAVPGAGATETIQYSTLKDNVLTRYNAASKTYGGLFGVRADLPFDWKGEAFYNYNKNQSCDSCVTGLANSAALQALVNAQTINPLSTTSLTDAQKALVYDANRIESRSTLNDVVAKANGKLIDLPAGPLKAAVGFEYIRESNALRSAKTTGGVTTPGTSFATSRASRNITAGFAELYVPIVSEDMHIPLVKGLRGSAAVRYDDYSDVGATTNPKFGLTWDLTDEFRLEGTWGTSFRAPHLTDVNPHGVTTALLVRNLPNVDPRIYNTDLPAGFAGPFGLTTSAILVGSNPALTPEESTNWSVGGVFSRGGLDVRLSYWDIEYTNQIAFPGVIGAYASAFTRGGDYQGWGPYITPIHNNIATLPPFGLPNPFFNPAQPLCSNSDINTADPALRNALQQAQGVNTVAGSTQIANNFCNVAVLLDSRIQNIGRVEMNGLDFSAQYFTQVGEVKLTGQVTASATLEQKVTVLPGATPTDTIGRIGDGGASGGFKWRGTAGVTADWQGFDATLQARYLSSVRVGGIVDANNSPVGGTAKLPSLIQFDLTLGYGQKFDEPVSGLKAWRGAVVITNLFDEYPTFITAPTGYQNPGWIPAYGSPFGRTFSVQLTADF